MGKLRVSLFALLTACGSDAAKQTDAPPAQMDAPKQIDAKVFNDAPPVNYDLSCVGNAAPTTAPATINITGQITELAQSGQNVAVNHPDGAKFDICDATGADCAGANHIGTEQTTAGGGNYTFTDVPTTMGSKPLDVYLTMTNTNDRPTLIYPAEPITANLANADGLTFPTATFNQFAGFLGQTAGNGTALVIVFDCTNKILADNANLTITVKQNGADVPNTTITDLGTLDASGKGIYLVTNIPPGATAIGATYKTMTLLGHTVKVAADTDTETIIRPGY
ncbi:MAG: hypothetical protein QM831_19985 [Kofleriaceae bacterium]